MIAEAVVAQRCLTSHAPSCADFLKEQAGIGDALDHLAGTWSDTDDREFRRAVSVFEEVDSEL